MSIASHRPDASVDIRLANALLPEQVDRGGSEALTERGDRRSGIQDKPEVEAVVNNGRSKSDHHRVKRVPRLGRWSAARLSSTA